MILCCRGHAANGAQMMRVTRAPDRLVCSWLEARCWCSFPQWMAARRLRIPSCKQMMMNEVREEKRSEVPCRGNLDEEGVI